MRHLLGSIWTSDNFDMTFVPTRTYPRINVYLSEDFVLLVPSGNCQSVLKRQQDPLQTYMTIIMIQIRRLYQYPRLQR